MLPVFHKHFVMIKRKSENERIEQSALSIKGHSIIAHMKKDRVGSKKRRTIVRT